MTLKDTEKLIELLRDNGVSHFKSLEVEIVFAPRGTVEVVPESLPPKRAKGQKGPPTGAAIPPVESVIPHHVNEVANLLKLSDNDLVEKMFPEFPPEGIE